MKTIIKSILYFSFAALVFGGCAKNDDFSVPTVVDPAEGLKATKTIEDIYGFVTTKMVKYEADDIIKGIIVSSDKEQTFFKEIYFVDETNSRAAVFKLDRYSTFVDYEIGSTVYIKLKDTYVQKTNGILTIGGQNGEFVGYLADPTFKKHIVASNKGMLSLKELEENYMTEVTMKEVIESYNKDFSYIGKLVRIKEVQFDSNARGKTYVRDGKATENGIESKVGYNNPLKGKVYFRTAIQNNKFKDLEVPNNSGTMTGVMTVYRDNDFQFVPRFTTDLDLKEPVFGSTTDPEVPEDPNIKVEPGKYLAFPGADFKDWKAFEGSMNKYGLKFAAQSKGQGWANSDALELKGTPEKSDYTFTAADVKVPTGATELSFLMKGTADARSLSINLYQADGTYVAYNVGKVTGSKRVEKSKTNKEEQFINNYDGVIDTKGEWVKIVLNLKGFNYNTSGKGDFIAFKHGGATKTIESKYDLIIDEIRFEDGTPVEGEVDPVDPVDPEVPNGDKMTILGKEGTFDDLISVNKQGVTVSEAAGKDNGVGIKVEGTSTNNGAGFSIGDIAVPAGAKNITFYIKGESTPGGKAGDRGALVVNTHDEGKLILANYSIKDELNNGKTGEITVIGANDNKNDYVGAIKTNGWVKVILPLKDVLINNTGKGGFLQFRFAKEGTFNVVIDQISFE